MDAYAFVMEKLEQGGEYAFLPEGTLSEMVKKLIELDEAFMERTGVGEGEEYDDEAALEELARQMKEAFPAHGMYMQRLSEDYLDYNEEYLDSIGAIDWE